MEKLSKIKATFNRKNLKGMYKNIKKGVQIAALGAGLTASTMLFTGCEQPTGGDTVDEQVIEQPTNEGQEQQPDNNGQGNQEQENEQGNDNENTDNNEQGNDNENTGNENENTGNENENIDNNEQGNDNENTGNDNENTGNENTDDQQEVVYGEEPYDKAIGNGNYILHNFIGENDKLTAENIVAGTNHYLGKAETYLKDFASNWNESMADRPAAQNYFANLITAVQNDNSFNTSGFDEAVSIMSANAKPYFVDIVKNLDDIGYRNAFYYCYRILANESYKEGLGSYRQYSSSQMDAYNTEKELIVNGFTGLDYDSEYGEGNFIQTATIMDAVLDNAVTNMNNNGQGINMKVEDLRQLINLSITTNSLAAMHDVTKYNLQHNQCSMSLGINVAISNAITETQQSQSQDMGL